MTSCQRASAVAIAVIVVSVSTNNSHHRRQIDRQPDHRCPLSSLHVSYFLQRPFPTGCVRFFSLKLLSVLPPPRRGVCVVGVKLQECQMLGPSCDTVLNIVRYGSVIPQVALWVFDVV